MLSSAVEAVPAQVWIAVSVASLVLALSSLALMPLLLVRMPADYATRKVPTLGERLSHARPRQAAVLLLRNLAGGILVLLGLVMLFVPGQGLLTVAAGLVLLDGPGKHRLLVGLLRRPTLARAVQRLRARRGVPLLEGIGHQPPASG